jgi:hypothetical protein
MFDQFQAILSTFSFKNKINNCVGERGRKKEDTKTPLNEAIMF